MKNSVLTMLLASTMTMLVCADGTERHWTGLAGNNDWTDSGNYDEAGVPDPTAQDTLVFPDGARVTLDGNDAASCNIAKNLYRMKVAEGAVVQSHTVEIKRKLEETPEELLSLAVTDIRQQFGSDSREIVLPLKPDFDFGDVVITVPQRGDKMKLLELSRRNALQYRMDLEKQRTLVDPERHQKRVLNLLKEALHLPALPEVIECFVNSNFQGDYPVAAVVQFVNGKPNKSAYRHFNIKTVVGPDDYASMKEVVRRRYSRLIEEEKPFPDLIVTDGGKGQMEVVRQVLQDELHVDIPIAGLVKDDRHRTREMLYGFPPMTVGIKPDSEIFRLMTQIQDEVHRFAITHHRKKFEKGFIHSEMADIKGIGKATAEKLLLELKSVKAIKEAPLERLASLIGPAKAKLVFDHFR